MPESNNQNVTLILIGNTNYINKTIISAIAKRHVKQSIVENVIANVTTGKDRSTIVKNVRKGTVQNWTYLENY